MKKILLATILILAFTVTACSNSNEVNKEGSDMDELNLQLQKEDEEAGETIEDNEIYSGIDELIESDSSIGIQDDFSLYPFDIAVHEDGSESMIFLAINRLNDPIKDMSFELTFGKQDGDYIFDGTEVFMAEEQFGVLEPNGVVPVLLEITPEEGEIYEGLTQDNVDLEIDNFDMDVE